MTDHAATLPRRARPRGGLDRVTVTLLAVAGFLAVFAVLANRLRAAPAAAPAPRVVVLRRVYRTTVVDRGTSRARGGRATVSVSTSGSASPATPTTRTSTHP